ncbi:MAG: hypothetical protein Q8N84_01045, partial [bacterium]|nr:hypothetical protein [bacterium]
GVVKKSGSWYEYNGEKLAQGREGARAYLKENPPKAVEIEAKIREVMKTGTETPLAVGTESESEAESSGE